MGNERLRASIATARLGIEELAEQVEVDPKTVQRWLKGRVPHARHRWAVARVLDEDEHYLWPPEDRGEPGASPNAELVAAYAHRADVSPTQWWQLFSSAQRQVDLLGYAMLFLVEQHPQLPALLQRKAGEGCRVRIALVDPASPEAEERDEEERLGGGLTARIRTARLYFGVLDDCPGVEIHHHRTPMYNSIFRFDDQMFVTPHLYGAPGYSAPLLHLRRKGGQGLFDGFAAHFEAIWATSAPAAGAAISATA
jgi:transcriptional regulator with XRE-family HTH domain